MKSVTYVPERLLPMSTVYTPSIKRGGFDNRRLSKTGCVKSSLITKLEKYLKSAGGRRYLDEYLD